MKLIQRWWRRKRKTSCWRCKLKFGSPSSFFYEHWGIKQVGSEACVGFPEEDLEEGDEAEERTEPIQRAEHKDVLGLLDTLVTFRKTIFYMYRKM